MTAKTDAPDVQYSSLNSEPRNMEIKGYLISFALLVLAGCATTPPTLVSHDWVSPSQAVQLAAKAAPNGVAGTFSLKVKNTGARNGLIFLDSEFDYRDQRNLTIAITRDASRHFLKRLGLSSIAALKGKRILVKGVARRVKIVIGAHGEPTDKYYYQTHVRVSHAKQIALRDGG